MKHGIVWLGLLLLGGCSAFDTWMEEGRPQNPDVETGSINVDGPPLLVSTDVFAVPEPAVRREPLAPYGNPARYTVLGETYELVPVAVGFTESGVASWYGRKFHGRLTSSGEPFDMFTFTAAHKTMPIPAWVRVTNVANGASLVVRVNDRGPFKPDRVLDLSWAAAKRLGFEAEGTAEVRYEVLAVPEVSPGLVANPLVAPAQAVLQVVAVSDPAEAESIAGEIADVLSSDAARVRVEPNGQGLYRVQVLPKPDESLIESVRAQLVSMGWAPQRLIAQSNVN